MPSFVFIEITDRDLNWLFADIGRILDNDLPLKPTHLTIRGPYASRIPHGVLAKCRERLKQDVFRIGSVGHFSNPGEHVVYLKIESPNLRSVWWKPDFSIEKFGFNPHLSLYRGPDEILARSLMQFFKHESVELNCAEFEVVGHVSKQIKLLPPEIPIRSYPFHDRISGTVRANLLDRLEVVVHRHHRKLRK